MSKTKFLKDLDKSLYVLAETERKDIINEYRDIIEEKVKHGKKENEAVLEFGSINELSREILSAYKVNPDYIKNDDDLKDSAKKLGNDFDSFVKKGAKKATDFTKEVVEEVKQNNEDITIDFIFELIFKGIATLVVMFIAALPFLLVKNIGLTILEIFTYPINHVLSFIWSLLIGILFLICCCFIFIAMFKQYFKKNSPKDDAVKKDIEIDTKPVKKTTNKSELVYTEATKVKKEKKGTPLLDILLAVTKAIVVIMMIPLIIFNVGLLFGVIITIYIMIKGLFIPGVLFGLIGLIIFFGHLQAIIFNSLFRKKKISISPFIVGIIFGIIGGVLCFEQIVNFNYYNRAPSNDFKATEVVNTKIITTDCVEFYNDINMTDYIIDDTLKDNEMRITLTYYADLIGTDQVVAIDEHMTSENCMVYANYYHGRVSLLSKEQKEISKLFIANFKKNEMYNYDLLYSIKYTVATNSKTSTKIQK